MAGELQYRNSATGETVYAVMRAADGQCVIQSSGGTETQVNANWGNYDIPLTETPASGYHHVGDFPSAAAAGWYHGEVYVQAGGSPATSDTLVGTFGRRYWDGSEFVFESTHSPTDVSDAMELVADLFKADVSGLSTFDALAEQVSVADKTGYSLASDGLDAISAAEPAGKPMTFAGWLMWLVQRFRRAKIVKTGDGTATLTVEQEDGTAVTEQSLTEDDTTQQVGAPT